jgi:CDP-ribitol ribitolphosphotransferase / teichoic acid ribitol-phosphate polymerase
MRAILFCYNPYAFGILKPLNDQLRAEQHSVLWYLRPDLGQVFPYATEVKWTSSMDQLEAFQPDAIFVPGNEVPHYLRGVKVQVFHGLAGEKKGHFRIRHYFDLYLTQGPYFTNRFLKSAKRYHNFEVVETGWPKLDPLFSSQTGYQSEKEELLAEHQARKIVLYAPTFSPSLTSAAMLIDEIGKIASHPDVLVMIKFHDLMEEGLKNLYHMKFGNHPGVKFAEDSNILKYLIMSDLMISDTSSVIYEFMLLDKPVITYKSFSKEILWKDLHKPTDLFNEVIQTLVQDDGSANRKKIIASYHPYADGKSSGRMIKAVEQFITRNGVPAARSLSLYRRWKIIKMFGQLGRL